MRVFVATDGTRLVYHFQDEADHATDNDVLDRQVRWVLYTTGRGEHPDVVRDEQERAMRENMRRIDEMSAASSIRVEAFLAANPQLKRRR